MESRLDALQKRLGHRFAEQALLIRALTPRSFGADHNERLEVLGDAVLNLAVIQSLAYRPADNVIVIGTHGNGMYYTFLGTANFNPVQTAVEPVTNDKNFIRNVYPTVSPNTVSFETGNIVGVRKIVVHLYDASGRLVFSETKGYTNGSLTLAPFARGTYFLSIYSEDRKYRHLQKLVKQ